MNRPRSGWSIELCLDGSSKESEQLRSSSPQINSGLLCLLSVRAALGNHEKLSARLQEGMDGMFLNPVMQHEQQLEKMRLAGFTVQI